MKHALLVPLMLAVTACYTYVPVDPGTLQPGARLRAYVNTETGTRLAGPLSPPIAYFTGDLADKRPDSLQVITTYFRTQSGSDITTDPTTVSVSPASLTRVETRRFSAKRSVLFTVALGTATYLLASGISEIYNAFTGGNNSGKPRGTN